MSKEPSRVPHLAIQPVKDTRLGQIQYELENNAAASS